MKPCINKNIVKQEDQERMAVEIHKAGVPKPLAFGVAGYLLDTTFQDDEDGDIIPILAALGAIGGMKRFRPVIKKGLNGFTKKVHDSVEPHLSKTVRIEGKRVKAQESKAFNARPANDEDLDMQYEMVNTLKTLGSSPKKVFESFLSNEWTQSTYRLLMDKAGDAGRQVIKTIGTLDKAINGITSSPKLNFNAKYGSSGFREYTEVEAPRMMRKKFQEQNKDLVLSDQSAQREFDQAVYRFMNSGRGEGGIPPKKDNPQIDEFYNDKQLGDYRRRIDDVLEQDEKFMDYVNSYRDTYSVVMDNWLKTIQERMTKRLELGIKDKAERKLIVDLIGAGKTRSKYLQTLDDETEKAFKYSYRNNDVFKRIVDLNDKYNKFTDLDRHYFPQLIDDNKLISLRNRIAREIKSEGREATKDEVTKRTQDYLKKTIYRLNEDKKSRRILKQYDSETQQVTNRDFTTEGKAKSMIAGIRNRHITMKNDELAKALRDREDDFIKSKVVVVKKDGEPVLNKDGSVKKRTLYNIEVPEDLDPKILELENVNSYKKLLDDLHTGAIVRKSGFLENPRVRYLPTEILNTSPQSTLNKYGVDVGRRLHFAKNGIMFSDDVDTGLLTRIKNHMSDKGFTESEYNNVESRTINAINYAQNLYGKNGEDIARQVKYQKLSDMSRNAFFARFGWGFSFYNIFEWAVVSPHISSFSSVRGTFMNYLQDGKLAGKHEEILSTLNIVRHQISELKPEYENIAPGAIKEDTEGILDLAHRTTGKAAESVADFSFTKMFTGKLFDRYDPTDSGISKLFLGSFNDSNAMTTTVNAMASIGEASELAKIAKRMTDEGVTVIKKDGKPYNLGRIKRDLERLGVAREDFDDFVARQSEYSEVVDNFTKTGDVDIDKLNISKQASEGNLMDNKHYEYMVDILQTSTNTYHGTDKIFRPEKWNTPLGRAMSMYASYPYNFAVQHVQRRVFEPVRNWNKRFGEDLGLMSLTGYKILRKLKSNDIKGLKEMGLTDEAIEEFPVESYSNILKHFQTLGISVAGFATLDVIRDVVDYPINELADSEQWQRINRLKTLNPYAPKSQQITWGDLDTDMGVQDWMKVGTYLMGHVARSGTFGKYGEIIENKSRLSREGIMSLTPLTSEANKVFKNVFSVDYTDLNNLGSEVGTGTFDYLVDWAPILGTSQLYGWRKAIHNQINNKNERNNRSPIMFQDIQNGEMIDEIKIPAIE